MQYIHIVYLSNKVYRYWYSWTPIWDIFEGKETWILCAARESIRAKTAEVPFCCPGCWHCCCGFIVTLTCVCPLPQWRNRYQQNFGEIIDLNPYSKKKGFFSLQIQDNASWNTQKESMRNTSIRARMTHNINSFHNWRHLNKIWDNTIQPGEGQPVCEGVRFSDSLAVNICRLFHTAQWHMSEKAT